MVDNFYQIPDSCFVDRNWPTEHYNYQGKKIVAENIKKAIIEEMNYIIKIVGTFCLLLSFSINNNAQDKHTISGYIKDAGTGEVLNRF